MKNIEYINKVTKYKTFVRKCATKIPQFVRFLKEKRLTQAYVNNSRHCIDMIRNGHYNNTTFTTTLQDGILVELINHAFVWCDTPEGDDFWYNLEIEWQTIANEMSEIKRKEIIKSIISMWEDEQRIDMRGRLV